MLKEFMGNKVTRKVKEVVDGDTIIVDRPVAGSKYIRLARIDTPEKGERGYETAKRNLKNRIKGRLISVDPVGKSYGRTVAEIRKIRGGKK